MKKIVTGAIIILAGVFLLFHNLHLVPDYYFRLVFSWQMLLIAIGAIQLSDRKVHHKDAGIFLILVGLVFLIPKALRTLDIEWMNTINIPGLILPVCLIGVGIYFLVKSQRRKSECNIFNHLHQHRSSEDFEFKPFTDMPANDSGYINREYIFSASKERITGSEIKRVEIDAVFSGVEIDFSQTELSAEVKNVHIKVSAVFSSVTLYLPAEWNVLVQKTGVFGGFVDKRFGKKSPNPDKKVIILELEAVFGGGEVKYYE
jgi:predicted membrane protein